MEIIIRILVALGIVFLTGLIIGILWGLYIASKEEQKKLKKNNKYERGKIRW